MSKLTNEGLSEIKYGELHIYNPLKLETSLKFDNICQAIQQSPVSLTEEYHKKILHALDASLSENLANFQKNYNKNGDIKIKMQEQGDTSSLPNDSSFQLDDSDIILDIYQDDKSIKFNFKHSELENINQRIERLEDEWNISKEIYGETYVISQQRFVLLPIKIKLTSNEWVWLNSILYLFNNNMGILKFELPLKNVDTTPFKLNNPDLFIKEIKNNWNIKDFTAELSFFNLYTSYIKQLFSDTIIDVIGYSGCVLRNIILVDYAGSPKHINSISDAVMEDLFRIIAAPVPEYEYTSYKRDAKNYLNSYNWGDHNVKYYLKTTGGCLSLIDQNLLNTNIDQNKEQLGVNQLEANEYLNLCEIIASRINVNAEFALIIIILKKINENHNYFQKVNYEKKLNKIKKEYWENILFISELQEGCYGTVYEQVKAFEDFMPFYLRKELTASKLNALEEIMEQDIQMKSENFQDFLSIGSLILTVIFGLPAIYEALLLIRTCFTFIPHDIPYVKINYISIFIWLLINSFLTVKIWNSRKKAIK